MARIAGVDLPSGKRVEIGLTYIYGIGRTRAKKILAKAKVDEGIKVKDLSEAEVLALVPRRADPEFGNGILNVDIFK